MPNSRTASPDDSGRRSVPETWKPWIYLGDRYGLPLLLLALVGMSIWRAASWFEPRATRLFDEHVTTVKELRSTGERQTNILSQMGGTLDEHGKQLSVTGRLVQEIHGAVIKNGNGVARKE